MDSEIEVKIKKLSPLIGDKIRAPYYATEGAAGMDLCACIEGEITIPPGERAQIPTGIAIQMPKNVVGLVFGRSGNAWRSGITLSNAVGVIDEDYTGEIKVLLSNLDSHQPFRINGGDRIAQIAFLPVFKAKLNFVNDLDVTLRGAGGFGSTGE